MALKIRLQRHGARHAPVYRMVVTESRHRRDGRFVENLGTYNPKARGQDQELNISVERADYWMGVGAQPSDTARSLIKRAKREGAAVPAAAPAAEVAPAAETAEAAAQPAAAEKPAADDAS